MQKACVKKSADKHPAKRVQPSVTKEDYDAIPDPEEEPAEDTQPCYKDGNLKNECWREE